MPMSIGAYLGQHKGPKGISGELTRGQEQSKLPPCNVHREQLLEVAINNCERENSARTKKELHRRRLGR